MPSSHTGRHSVVLAVDPGRDKCGLAVVTPERVLFRALCPTAEIGLTCRYLLAQHPQAVVAVGQGTGSEGIRRALREACPQASLSAVDERDSTLEARRLYWLDTPPRGWQRLVPRGMLVPPRPVDDYAAVVLARRYLEQAGAISAR